MYPTTFAEYITVIGALSPLVIWAVSGVLSAWTRAKEASSARWRRIHELAATLYNKDNAFGLWAQVVAVRELEAMGGRQRVAALEMLKGARKHFANDAAIVPVLDQTIEKMDKCWLKRCKNV